MCWRRRNVSSSRTGCGPIRRRACGPACPRAGPPPTRRAAATTAAPTTSASRTARGRRLLLAIMTRSQANDPKAANNGADRRSHHAASCLGCWDRLDDRPDTDLLPAPGPARRMSSARGVTGTSARSACAMPPLATTAWNASARGEDGSPATDAVRRPHGFDHTVRHLCLDRAQRRRFRRADGIAAASRRQLVDVVARRRRRRVLPVDHLGVSAQRDHPHSVQHVRAVRGRSAAGDLAGPVALQSPSIC